MQNNGLRDEASNEFWSFYGNATLDGSCYNVYSVPSGSAKFGWRAFRSMSTNDYTACSNSYGTFKLNSQGNYEIECFIQPVDSTAGNIVAFLAGNNPAFTISREASGKIKLTCSAWDLNASGALVIGSNSWHHIRVRISNNSAMLYVDGVSAITANLTANVSLNITECRIGGFNGYIDEFVYRDALDSTTDVPTSQYKAQLDISAMGGFGSGKHGALYIPAGQSVAVNAYSQGLYEGDTGNKKIKVWAWNNGSLGTPNTGDELMFLIQSRTSASADELTGKYAFRYITACDGTNITLDRPLDDDFSLTEARQNYYVRIYHIPHFTSVNIEEGGKLWGRLLGLGAFRCTGNVTVKGAICPNNNSLSAKVDNVLLTHADLPDRFIPSAGGGFMIFCGGTLSCSSTGIIGRRSELHAKANAYGRGGNGGGSTGQQGGIMKGGNASDGTLPNWKNYGPCILIAANNISVDEPSISTGGLNGSSTSAPGQYSGLLYIAGNFA